MTYSPRKSSGPFPLTRKSQVQMSRMNALHKQDLEAKEQTILAMRAGRFSCLPGYHLESSATFAPSSHILIPCTTPCVIELDSIMKAVAAVLPTEQRAVLVA